ncbi:MAG TPA: metallophosphoesterase [Candidatus Dormibacteraeota bacterium]|jgi:Icc-related predicted phosphoesterase|nr:metallophosphoesterase [Candidatus Dormibacteraeota bacterium]
MAKSRIFFASDVHGSERCWRKFLNAGRFYKANVLIMGGDIAGKLIIPIVRQHNGTYKTTFHREYELAVGTELRDLERAIRDSGYYPVRLTPDEVAELQTKEAQDELFKEVMAKELGRWLQIAEDKLKGSGIRCYASPGNDDIWELDQVLRSQSVVETPDGGRVTIDDEHEMVGSGYSTPTPWHTERECTEEEYADKIEDLVGMIESMPKAIFDIHCPPFDSGLDSAPEITEDLKPVTILGQPQTAPVGSKAVKAAIQRYQPLLGLHGHVHESRGIVKIGRTVCINPGSEYTEGILAGALVGVDGSKVEQFQLISG